MNKITEQEENIMAESMKGLKRTHRCGELSAANVGENVTVMGWVQKQRNKGGIIFVDMRDRAGILQVIFEESDCGTENFEKATTLRVFPSRKGWVCQMAAVIRTILKTISFLFCVGLILAISLDAISSCFLISEGAA